MTNDNAVALAVLDEDRAISRPDAEQARAALAHLSATGDVSQMTKAQRAAFILYYCRSLGLNPATGPVEIIEFYDPESKSRVAKVYVKAGATQQLGNLHRIRIETLSEEMVGKGFFKVSVRGHAPDGRTVDEVGYVSLTNKEGHPLAPPAYKNALMRCHTVAKRRLILGMIGLSAPPEADAPGVRRRYLGADGALLENPSEQDRYLNDHPEVAAISGRPRFETQEPAADTGLEGMPDQRPKPEVISPPKPPPGPRATFKRSDEDVKRLLGAWFAAVKGTSLDTDEARHQFIGQWCEFEVAWPKAKRTESLATFFARATDAEAADLLAHVRAVCADERAELLAEAAEQDGVPDDASFDEGA